MTVVARGVTDLSAVVERVVSGFGFELVDFETSPRGRTLRVFIDRSEQPGAISVEDCALVSNQLSRVFEVENVDYDRLEVSSPGLDRVLKKVSDFERFVGRRVQIKLIAPRAGRRNFTGVIAGVEQHDLHLADGETTVVVDLRDIERARLVPEW
ncbi:MAG: hypothetical protein AMXMBFR6_23510 [Betaproteobacteria bacterium]|nr:Ribosome maturation factor RimP [Rhodocyclaceae bacterium]